MHRIVGSIMLTMADTLLWPRHSICMQFTPSEHQLKHAEWAPEACRVNPAAPQTEIAPAQEDRSKHECCLSPSIGAVCNVLGMFSTKLFQPV